MRHLGRPALFGIVLILAGFSLLSLRGSTLADSPYFGPTILTSGPTFLSFAHSNSPSKSTTNFPAQLSNPSAFQTYAGLPGGFSLGSAYYLDGGSAFTIPVNAANPTSAIVYKISADGTISQYFDVSFDLDGHLLISTAGEVAPATYLVGTLVL